MHKKTYWLTSDMEAMRTGDSMVSECGMDTVVGFSPGITEPCFSSFWKWNSTRI